MARPMPRLAPVMRAILRPIASRQGPDGPLDGLEDLARLDDLLEPVDVVVERPVFFETGDMLANDLVGGLGPLAGAMRLAEIDGLGPGDELDAQDGLGVVDDLARLEG